MTGKRKRYAVDFKAKVARNTQRADWADDGTVQRSSLTR